MTWLANNFDEPWDYSASVKGTFLGKNFIPFLHQTVVIFSDSRYLIDAFQKGWITTWIEKGWRNSKNKPVKNTGLWKELVALTKQHSVTFEWVAGHNGHTHNEAADRLATGAADYLAHTGEVGPWARRIS